MKLIPLLALIIPLESHMSHHTISPLLLKLVGSQVHLTMWILPLETILVILRVLLITTLHQHLNILRCLSLGHHAAMALMHWHLQLTLRTTMVQSSQNCSQNYELVQNYKLVLIEFEQQDDNEQHDRADECH